MHVLLVLLLRPFPSTLFKKILFIYFENHSYAEGERDAVFSLLVLSPVASTANTHPPAPYCLTSNFTLSVSMIDLWLFMKANHCEIRGEISWEQVVRELGEEHG